MSKYTEGEIEQVENLCRDLLVINEELNAKMIAMDAYVRNTDKKNVQLQLEILKLKDIINRL
jgi:hypothetical protein